MSARPVIGLLVIGQAPRPALLAEFRHVLGESVTLDMRGALDHLDEAGLAAAAPHDDADTLYTTLPDGRSVLISKAAVTQGMAARLHELGKMGATAAFVCCTGKFPSLAAPGVHFASDLLAGAVQGCLPQGRLGVFIPTPSQEVAARARWGGRGYETGIVSLQPDAGEADIRAAAQLMAKAKPELVVHDCISYTSASRRLAASIHGAPALLAATVTARFAAELAGL